MSDATLKKQRQFFRLKLDPPLCADMTIVLIRGKSLETGSTTVLIEDLSAGGLRFLSHLKMPASDQLVLQFDTELAGQKLSMYGHLVRCVPWEEIFYEYAVRFTMDESEHQKINQLVNLMAIRYRTKRIGKDSRFFHGDPKQFLLELSKVQA